MWMRLFVKKTTEFSLNLNIPTDNIKGSTFLAENGAHLASFVEKTTKLASLTTRGSPNIFSFMKLARL